MKKSKIVIASAVSGLIALSALSGAAMAAKPGMEKCYGVAKAGKNDCQTNSSACAGTAKEDNQKDAWIYVPEGTCGKIAGGSTEPGK
ncbi:MAG: DUF2282 domain-containing protein [Gammaproteobacteria bacterium]|nr:MAG: DUF2282 domain-containing protein [Gammaproteobacteria bacterium]